MNFEILKMGFKAYLEEQGKIDKNDSSLGSNEISIFMYANDFKEYLGEKLAGNSTDIKSKSVSDILKMEFTSDGRLVDPEELEAYDTAIENNGETGEGAATTGAEVVPTDGAAAGAVDGEAGAVAMPEAGAAGEAGAIGEAGVVGETGEGAAQEEAPADIFTDVFNELLQDDVFKDAIDTDGSGDIDEKELKGFLNSIKTLDGNADDVSIDDLLMVAEKINNNEFNTKEVTDTLPPDDTDNTNVDKADNAAETNNANAANNTSGGGNVGGGGGSVGGGGGAYNSGNSAPAEKTLQNMSEAELQEELKKANGDLTDKQSALNAILDGTDATIKGLEEAVDKAYEAYQEQLKSLDEDMAKQVDDLQKKIDDKQGEIDDKDKEISDQECAVSDAETSYKNAKTSRENLELALSKLESDSSKDGVAEKISAVKGEIATAKEAETKAEEAWNKAKDDLDKLKNERKELEEGEGGLNELNEQMTQLEADIAEKYPEIKEKQEAWDKAKEDLTTQKASAVEKAKGEVETAQKYVNEVNTALSAAKDKQKMTEYCGGEFAAAVDWARQYDDYSQSQIQAIFSKYGHQFDYNAWCADFVKMSLYEGVGEENLPDWYKNCSNKAYCPTIQSAGEGHKISAEEAQTGDIVLFDWNNDGSADHVGLFIDNGDGSSTITTIEGNTSGAGGSSCVEEKSRNRGTVLGIYSMRS